MTEEMRLEFAKRMVDQLNELQRLDQNAATSIVYGRITVNWAVADSPDFVVGPKRIDGQPSATEWEMGIIGMLNGILGNDRIRLASLVEDEGPMKGHAKGFCLVDMPDPESPQSRMVYPERSGPRPMTYWPEDAPDK